MEEVYKFVEIFGLDGTILFIVFTFGSIVFGWWIKKVNISFILTIVFFSLLQIIIFAWYVWSNGNIILELIYRLCVVVAFAVLLVTGWLWSWLFQKIELRDEEA